MKITEILFISTFLIFIQGRSTLNIGHTHPRNRLTEIQARSSNNRFMNGFYVSDTEYGYSAYIFYSHYQSSDLTTDAEILDCLGVLIAPEWVVTVARCFDTAIAEMKKREKFSNLVWQYRLRFPDVHDGWVKIASDLRSSPGYVENINRIYVPGRYDLRYDKVHAVDVALVSLQESIPRDVARPPVRIDDDLLHDGSRIHPENQDCWTVSAGQSSPGDKEDVFKMTDMRDLRKLKVVVGNGRFCEVLQEKLYKGKTSLVYDEEYVCAKVNKSVHPGDRSCLGDDGAALVCGNRLLGLLSKRYESGKCEDENVYAVYVYLGHGWVYNWIRGIVNGEIETQIYRSAGSDESSSGLVEARKTMTLLLTAISVAMSVNTFN